MLYKQKLFGCLLLVSLASLGLSKRKSLLIGIDGMAADQLHKHIFKNKKAPSLKSIFEKGLYSPCPNAFSSKCGQTHKGIFYRPNYRWVTAPGWASVLTGMNTHVHKVAGNDHKQQIPFSVASQSHPSFLKILKDSGHATAATGVANFLTTGHEDKINPGILDYECGASNNGPSVSADATSSCNLTHRLAVNGPSRDEKMAKWAVKHIVQGTTDSLMVVFDEVDSAGHHNGFRNKAKYFDAIDKVDSLISRLLIAIQARVAEGDEFLVMLSSDHGGHNNLFKSGGGHDVIPIFDQRVPFAMALYGSKTKLTKLKHPSTQMDLKPTILHWHGLKSEANNGNLQGFRQ